MKGTIIGTDLLQKGNDVQIIEINTNTTIFNDGANLLDYDSLFNVLISNNITELHFIYTAGSSFFPANASSFIFEDKLKEKCLQNNISYHNYIVPENSVTVPYIEDSPNKFILRQAFDTTALVDESYCADKFGFLNLMSGSNYIPKSFFNDESLGIDSISTINLDNPNQPNYVIKVKSPAYDANIYPELYELTSQEQLNELKSNLPANSLMQEFIYDSENIVGGRWSIIRSIDIIYGSNLDTINMGGYKQSTIIPMDFSSNEFLENTTKYNQKTRYKYINKQLFNTLKNDYHVDDNTMILDYTGSLKDVDTIILGDYIKSINFTDLSGSSVLNVQDITTFGWHGTLEHTIQTLTEVSSSLVGIQSASVDTIFVQITLENGLTWDDAPSATYYIEESGSLSTRWDRVNNFYIGDKFVVKNTITNQLETLAITNLQMVHAQKIIYDLNFEDSDLFLVDIGDGMFGIMHNSCWCCYNPCGHWCCDNSCNPCNQGLPPKL
jgi:hypothetical protein